jgi:chromosomal replication initiation ATPase DnaA
MTPLERLLNDAARARFACNAVAFAFSCEPQILIEARGPAPVAFARQVAMYLTHVAFGMSLQRVAQAFSRDRSTVAYACHAIEDRRDDPHIDDMLDKLEASLRAAPAPTIIKQAA